MSLPSYKQVVATVSLTATSGGVSFRDQIPSTVLAGQTYIFLFQPGRSGDVELRYDAADSSRRHIIPQNAGGDEPYPDGLWDGSGIPFILYAATNTAVVFEILQV